MEYFLRKVGNLQPEIFSPKRNSAMRIIFQNSLFVESFGMTASFSCAEIQKNW